MLAKVGVEGFAIGVGDVEEAVADFDVAGAAYGGDFVQGDDEGAVDAHEARGQHLFHRFHRDMRDEWLLL